MFLTNQEIITSFVLKVFKAIILSRHYVTMSDILSLRMSQISHSFGGGISVTTRGVLEGGTENVKCAVRLFCISLHYTVGLFV